MTTIGIDAGTNGGIAWFDEDGPRVEKMPETKEESRISFSRQTPAFRFSEVPSRKKEASHAQVGELFRLHKGKGFLDRYYANHSQCDEQPLHQKEVCRSFFPSLPYVRKPFLLLRSGASASIPSVLFSRLISPSLSRFSKRDDFGLIAIRSSTSYCMLIFHQLEIFGKSAKAPDFRIRNKMYISSKTSAPLASLWLFFFRRNAHPPLSKGFFRYG